MPLVGAAAVTGAAAIYGAHQASNGQKRAAKAQTDAAHEAIAYQERQQAAAKAERQAMAANWQKRYDAYIQQFYGGSAKPNGSSQIPAFQSAPVGAPGAAAQSPAIPDLIRGMGTIRANAEIGAGNAWGQGLANAGAGIGTAIKNRPTTPEVTMTGAMQPTGVSPTEAGINPTAFNSGGWSDWDKYMYPEVQ
jgi:hypothetical protein